MNYVIYFLMAVAGISIIAVIVRRSRRKRMAEPARRLEDLFLTKEDWERYLAGLEELGHDDTSSRDSYVSMREGYRQSITAIIEEIAAIKSALRRELENRQMIRQAYEVERERLAAKFKTGELPLQKYESLERKLQKKTKQLEPDIRAIERLISAESAAEVQMNRRAHVKKEGSSRRRKVMGIAGGVVLIGVIAALLISGVATPSSPEQTIASFYEEAEWLSATRQAKFLMEECRDEWVTVFRVIYLEMQGLSISDLVITTTAKTQYTAEATAEYDWNCVMLDGTSLSRKGELDHFELTKVGRKWLIKETDFSLWYGEHVR